MDQKTLFLSDFYRRDYSMTELCLRYGVSRKTGYKWVRRYECGGPPALADRSRRPRTCPHQTAPEVIGALLDARRHHPSWGPKKLLAVLGRRYPLWPWPAASTAGAILQRHGLVPAQRRRRRLGHPGRPRHLAMAPNEIWTIDFKGQFRLLSGSYCYPLTLADSFSRYLLTCRALTSPAHEPTQAVLTRVFREFGLPQAIRSDNGAPFASTALGRLSRLSVWWIRLGIRPELIEPARPDQNGAHERMHRTLKRETTRPAAASLGGQQRRFNVFRETFNDERPHEALGQRTPASIYQPSPRDFPSRMPRLEYPSHYEVRLVSRNGGIRWHSNWVNVSHVLAEQHVGLEEIDDGQWNVYFGPVTLGRLHERSLKIVDHLGRSTRRQVSPMSQD